MIGRLPWLLLFCVGAALAAPEDELLPADQAFSLTTRVTGATLEASWRIARGYYLYRDKFKFEALDPALRFDAPSFPPGKVKEDPYFGRSEIYFNRVTVRLPFERLSDAGSTRVRITAQGCNEPVGVCYPPIVKELALALPAGEAKPGGLSFLKNAARNRSGSSFAPERSAEDAQVIDPDQAFQVDAVGLDAHTLGLHVSIADCCYLYRDKMRFNVTGTDGAPLGSDLRLAPIDLPPGEIETDDYVGRTEVYRRGFDLRLPLLGTPPASGFAFTVGYQGCADKGVTICYPPAGRRFPVAIERGSLTVGAPEKIVLGAATAATRPPVSTRTGRGAELFLAMLGAFGAGLLLTFTPCVLPMIPIISSVLVGAEGARLSKLRGGLLSYAYVFGTALTYSAAGAVAGATGEQLQAYFQNPWAIGIFSAILVLFALSMFGLYEIHVPHAIQSFLHHHSTRVHHKAKRWIGGEFVGVFLLGVFSALIIGACVTPVLASTLAGAIATRDPVQGASIMFALANGQGAVLVAIGISEGLLLPRSGPWMNTVKHVFGVLLVAVAIYLLSPLESVPVLLLWGAFLIVCGVYLGATQALPKEASGWQYLWKGIGTLLLVWGVLALIGGFSGRRDILRPLPVKLASAVSTGANTGSLARVESPLFQRVSTYRELDARLGDAQRAGKPVILDYYATWCTDCVRMERSTLRDPRVRQAVARGFVALQADVTENDDDSRAMKKRFGVYGPPTMLFLKSDGSEIPALRFSGYKSADELLEALSRF
jgi:thioredoxin:protein disulfide reductase